MKIKAKPEGRDGIFLPERESLKAWIIDQKLEQIHNFIPTDHMMLGADHEVESVLQDIDDAERVALLVSDVAAGNLGHCLSLIKNNKLEVYDIGTLTVDDIEHVD